MKVVKDHSFVLGWNAFANFQIQDSVSLFQSQGKSKIKKVDEPEGVLANISSPVICSIDQICGVRMMDHLFLVLTHSSTKVID
jgi:hypothetical protein